MAQDAPAEEYVCPNCNEPVNAEWKACPNCGVEFAAAEEDAPAPPEPAKAAAPAKPPATLPAKATPPKAAAKPPKKESAPKVGKEKAPKPPKEKAPAKPRALKGPARGPAFLAPITGRFGLIGLLGLPVAVFGLGGFFAISNWDTMFGGQAVNSIGPNQSNAMLGAVAVAGLGVFLTILGFTRARLPHTGLLPDLEPGDAGAQAPSPEDVTLPGRAPVLIEVPEPEVEPEPSPAPAPAARPAPSRAPAAVAQAAEEAAEEEGEIEIPSMPAPAPSPPRAAPRPPAVAPAAPAPPSKLAAPGARAAAADHDELEDLFGELESEVAKAEEEEVHYECPNCHGIVGESDTSCPHCHVTFEG